MIKPKSHATHKPQHVSIHKATMEDAAAIATLAKELAAYEQTESVCSTERIETLLSSSHQPQCTVLTAKASSQLIAFAIFYPGYDLSSDTYGFHVADICVAAAHRRQGIGKALMKEIATITREQHRHWISLTVLENNRLALDFYRSLGLSKVPVYFMAAGQRMLSSIG